MKKLLLVLASLVSVGNVMAQCSASLISSFIPRGNNLLSYDFVNTSGSGAAFAHKAVSTTIDFGDGSSDVFSSSNSNYIRHNYPSPGTYNVSMYLSVYDSMTSAVVCADTLQRTLVLAYRPCAFTVASSKVNDSTYTFTATNATSNPAASFRWWFGDGTTGSGPVVTHTYPSSGLYSVNCYDSVPSCAYQNGLSVNVSFLGPFHCDSVTKYMSATVSSRHVTMSTSQTGLSNYPGKAISFMFNYGDGSPVTSSNTHAYSALGSYSVKGYVTITDSASSTVLCRDTLSDLAHILALNASINVVLTHDSASFGYRNFKVWLIHHDTAAGVLSAVDSATFGSWGYRAFPFTNVPAGRYLVKGAEILSSTGLVHVPTYSDSSLLWSGGRAYHHNGLSDTWNASIYMRTGTTTSGPGFVGGSVSLGANKGTASGAPGVSMILYNGARKMVAMTETDAQGNYSFSNLPVGDYVVLPELLGYDASSSAPFSITASGSRINGISFTKDDTKMSIRAASLGIGKTNPVVVSVSPNPARNSVRIVADGKQGSALELRDLSGKVVHRADIGAGAVLNLDVRSFPAGLYFLHAGSGAPLKLVIE